MRAPGRVREMLEDALRRWQVPAEQIVNQLPSRALPPSGNTGSGYTPAHHDHVASEITDFLEATQDALAGALVAGSHITIAYDDATGKVTISATVPSGGGDMLKSTYDTDNDGIVDAAAAAPWSGIVGKPMAFPPSAHGHGIGDLPVAASGASSTTQLVRADDSRLSDARTPTAHAASHRHGGADEIATATSTANAIPKANGSGFLDGWVSSAIARLVDLTWGNIAGKPATFAPSAHKTTHATGGSDALVPTDIGAAAASHSHGIGDLPVAASGTSSTTALVRADDSRLSDARAPTAHTHAAATTSAAGFQSATDKVKQDAYPPITGLTPGHVLQVLTATSIGFAALTAAQLPAHSHTLADLPATVVAGGGSGAAGRVPFFTDGRTLSSDAALSWDTTNQIFSIGPSGVAAVAGRAFLSVRGTSGPGIGNFATGAADANGNLVGLFQFTDVLSTSDENRVAGFGVRLDGTTANRRGGTFIVFTKADNTDTFTERSRWTNTGAFLHGKSSGLTGAGDLDIAGKLQVGGNVGFYNTAPVAKQTVTGSRGGNAALASLLTALANLGLITNSSS